MRRTQIEKPKGRFDRDREARRHAPLSLDARDPDITRAKQAECTGRWCSMRT